MNRPKVVVLLAFGIMLAILAVSTFLFRSPLPVLFAPLALCQDSVILSDWRLGDSLALVYLWTVIVICGFAILAFLAWKRNSGVPSFVLCGLTSLWGIMLVILYFRVKCAIHI
jgi:hypothetical protein